MSKDLAARYLDRIAEAERQWVAHGWPEAAPGMAAVTSLVRVTQVITTRLERALAPFGLTFARFEIMRLLGFTRTGALPMGKIGERLQVHPASVTSAVKRLERDGLIIRRPDDEDSRIVLAALLPAGRRKLEESTRLVNGIFESVGLGQDDLRSLRRLLDKLRAQAGDSVT